MSLNALVEQATLRLQDVVTAHHPATFASSFGMEDMVILDMLGKLDLDVEVFTLDTGRLHAETHELIERARQRYGQPIRVLYPDQNELELFVAANGTNAFFDSVDLRKRCCAIRKVAPLRRALQGKKLWITGMRRQQSVTRAELDLLLYDGDHGLFKLNPLIEWTTQDVTDYVRVHDVPVNALHATGYPSIGCAPCTRAVQSGEDERAGRWWWEQPESRECGLHMDSSGRLVRAAPG
jgi:phosphoadenosine phosphosulfate reductase